MLLLLLQLAKFASGEEQGKTPGDGFSRDNVIGVLSVASQIGDFFRTSALTAQFFFIRRQSCAGHVRVNIYVVVNVVFVLFAISSRKNMTLMVMNSRFYTSSNQSHHQSFYQEFEHHRLRSGYIYR